MKTKLARSRWILVAPAVAAAGAYFYFLFLPGQRSLASLHEELNAAEQFIAQVEAFGPAIEATRQQLDKTRQYVDQWEQTAPTEDGLSGVFGRINRLAKESGITTTRFEPQPAILYDSVRCLPVAVTCVGSFGQICRFLQALEGLEETIWVESLQMQRTGEDREDVECGLSLAIFADNPGDSDQIDPSD